MCIWAAYSNAPLGNSASRWWELVLVFLFPCFALPLRTSPSHFPSALPFALPLRTSLPHFSSALSLRTFRSHFPFVLPLRTSPLHFPFVTSLRTSPSYLPFALPLRTSPSHFPSALPLVGRPLNLVLECHTSPVRSLPRSPPTCTAFSSLTNQNWETCKAFAVRSDHEDPPGFLSPLVIGPSIE